MGNSPSVTYPSPNEYPITVYPITNITNASRATVTCPTYSFTDEDTYVTQVTFKQVKGMTPINGLTSLIIEVVDSQNFVVNVNTSEFPPYTSDGVICIDTGQPVVEQQGSQWFNTPFQNTF